MSTKSLLKRLLTVGFESVLLIVLVLTVASFFGNLNPYFELLSHTRHLLFIFFLVWTIILGSMKRKWSSGISAFFLVIHTWILAPYYVPKERSAETGTTTVSFLQLNVQGGLNSDFDTTIDLIESTDPDIVALTEITPTWAKNLNSKLKNYRYKKVEPRLGGVAIYSKYELLDAQIKYFGEINRPRILSKITIDDTRVQIIFAHPVIPTKYGDLRNQEFEELAKDTNAFDGPVILLGDLNCTPWSCYFQKLLKQTGLNDSERGFGIQPTWSDRWITPIFPIDHLLSSSHFVIQNRKTLSSIHSDHLPVLVECYLKEKAKHF